MTKDVLLPTAALVGADVVVPCLDGIDRPYRDLDCAASTPALQVVADKVTEFLPWYSSVHRGAGYKSRQATKAYEAARESAHVFANRPSDGSDVVILVRNTTEAINQLAYRLGLGPDDVVATTVVEHHANLLPWARVAQRRWVECGPDGTFTTEDVVAVLDDGRPPALLTLTGASNVTGWLPPIDEICAQAHARGIPVLLDAAQLAPHRPLPTGPDFIATFPAATSSTPRLAPAPSSAPAPCSRPATRSWPAAAPSTWSIWTRSSGPTRPIGRRPAHPT